MENNISEVLSKLMYNGSKKEIISYIKSNTDPKILHYIAYNYNWDDGFDIPKTIIENKYCDLGTALMVYDDAEGYLMFWDEERKKEFGKNAKFVSSLKLRIEKKNFTTCNIKYTPSLSHADTFRLKKHFPEINRIFIEGTDGEELDIPII